LLKPEGKKRAATNARPRKSAASSLRLSIKFLPI
jgi:hypothetical protein